MHSIRTKLTLSTILAILVSVLSIGFIAIITFSRESTNNAEEQIRLVCEETAGTLNAYLNSISQSVDIISREALNDLDTGDLVEYGAMGCTGEETAKGVKERKASQQRDLDRYLKDHLAAVETYFKAAIDYTNGAETYYYILNPELSTETGLLYTKIGREEYVSAEMPKVTDYTEEDPGPFSLYYNVLERGEPSWIEIYDDEVLGTKLLSYIVPIYKAGSFIGMIGMDISYETIVGKMEEIAVYNSGYASLFDQDDKVLYHPSIPFGTPIRELTPDLDRALKEGRAEETEGVGTIRFQAAGILRLSAYTKLSNGMTLSIIAPVSEINAGWTRMRNTILIVSLLILAAFAIIVSFWMKKMTDPLKQLSVAARLVSAGKYDVDISYEGDDEIGVLTDSFRRMRDQMKDYIGDLRGQAFTDSLTHVRNKRSFDQMMQQLDGEIVSGEAQKKGLAIVMFDCNFLKSINDTYGHEKGDIYLQNACRMICKTFRHSPVFRLGGDEFVAVLQNEDYFDRDLLIGEFKSRIAEQNAAAGEPWQRVDISLGLTSYDPKADFSAEEIFARADARMYEAKKAYKDSLV